MIDWKHVTAHNNPDEMSPWITHELLREIHKRDFLKNNAASTNDPSIWKQFQDARNKACNLVKKA